MSTRTRRIVRPFVGQGPVIRAAWILLLVVAMLSVVGPLTPWLDPYATSTSRILDAPSWDHWLGTDGAGRDVFARVLVGARTSLLVGVASVTVLVSIATLTGATAGYFGGWVDALLSRLIDALLSIPLLLLVTVFIALLRPGVLTVILVIGLLGWPATARVIRAETLSLRQRPFVAASRLSGMTDRQILIHHVMPNLGPVLVVATSLGLGTAILMESTISFLGLGIRPPTASLGSIVSLALDPGAFRSASWIWLPGSVVLAGIVIAVNLIGDSLRHLLDPTNQRGSHDD